MNYFNNGSFKFIDLFSGIGGFHVAMQQLHGECVLASEIDKYAIDTYMKNFGIDSNKDITKLQNEEIPEHDVLCAGFPCQAFSKAGAQNGFADPTRGTLFFEIARILKYRKPKFIILENVRNLVAHDKGNTWRVIRKTLTDIGYILPKDPIIVSPHQLGIPQLRERVYILGIHESLGIKQIAIDLPKIKKSELSVFDSGIIEDGPIDEAYNISPEEEYVINAWDEFYQGIKEKIIGFPIWFSEFRSNQETVNFPKWQQDFCRKNRDLYHNNQEFIDKWLRKYDNLANFSPTNKKFEWQCGEACKSVWDGIIQFRPSGIRVKRPDTFPALVAMVHIPIIGKYRRRLTPRETANLQNFPDDFIINENAKQAYKQFGNAVNVKVVKYLAEQLFNLDNHSSEAINMGEQIKLEFMY